MYLGPLSQEKPITEDWLRQIGFTDEKSNHANSEAIVILNHHIKDFEIETIENKFVSYPFISESGNIKWRDKSKKAKYSTAVYGLERGNSSIRRFEAHSLTEQEAIIKHLEICQKLIDVYKKYSLL